MLSDQELNKYCKTELLPDQIGLKKIKLITRSFSLWLINANKVETSYILRLAIRKALMEGSFTLMNSTARIRHFSDHSCYPKLVLKFNK